MRVPGVEFTAVARRRWTGTGRGHLPRRSGQCRDLGIEFVDADWNLAKDAGYFKSKNKMSFADCFAAALAKQRKAHLATGDPEFKQVESEIAINWLID